MTSPDPPFTQLLADLGAEADALLYRLREIDPDQWVRPTPAQGWTVLDQVTHLMYFDEAAIVAVTDPERFRVHAEEMQARGPDFPDQVAAELRSPDPGTVVNRFDQTRRVLIAAYRNQDPHRRLPWYGPDMSVMSAATARVMETWAHGVDIADTFGWTVNASPRLRNIAHLGYATRRFSFTAHGLEPPADDPRVELHADEDGVWAFGPPDAANRVEGPALDFCLVVCQRRPVARTSLRLTGPDVEAWMAVAQAFAGRPTTVGHR